MGRASRGTVRLVTRSTMAGGTTSSKARSKPAVRSGALRHRRRPARVSTVDYGHIGTVVDVEVIGGALQVTQTDIYPPGTPTLSGVITGITAGRPVTLEGVEVWRGISTGWRVARTDRNGFYEIRGLIDGNESVAIVKDGYEKQTVKVVVAGDTRFDIELTEAPSQ